MYVCMYVGRCWGWMVSVVWGSGIGKEKREKRKETRTLGLLLGSTSSGIKEHFNKLT